MGQTPTYALPYPEPGDPAAIPQDMQDLAAQVDTVFGQQAAKIIPPPVWGGVNGDGTVWVPGSGDWTSVHVSAGRVTVTFNTPMAVIPAVSITTAGGTTMISGLLLIAASGFDATFYDVTASAYADCTFLFTASDFQ